MAYFQIAPNSILQEYVKYFWVFEGSESPSQTSIFKILPDGLPSLIYQDTANLFVDTNSKVVNLQLNVYHLI